MSDDFETNVVSLLDLDDKIEEKAKELTALRKKHGEVNAVVLKYMIDANKKKCETSSANFVVSHSVGQASLSIPVIKRVMLNMFDAQTTEIFLQKLAKERQECVDKRVRLKKIKKKTDSG